MCALALAGGLELTRGVGAEGAQVGLDLGEPLRRLLESGFESLRVRPLGVEPLRALGALAPQQPGLVLKTVDERGLRRDAVPVPVFREELAARSLGLRGNIQ